MSCRHADYPTCWHHVSKKTTMYIFLEKNGDAAAFWAVCYDDFGIKYVGCEHINHLSGILSKHYKCSQYRHEH